MTKQFQERAMHLDRVRHLPSNSDQPMSMGSRFHFQVACRPCAFTWHGASCPVGAACRFCHFPHPEVGEINMRPCKGKRDRLRKRMERLFADIEADPEAFNMAAVEVPSSIAANPVTKSKFLELVERKLQLVRRRAPRPAQSGPAPCEPPVEGSRRL